jgi:prefoldin subunit 5
MPLAAKDNLDELYAQHRLLQGEVDRLQAEYDALDPDEGGADRRYLLDIEIDALQAEATSLASRISDILERDLQR